MTIVFNTLMEFNNRVYRNIRIQTFDFDEFDDLTNDPKAKACAHAAAKRSAYNQKDLEHNAIEYIFKLKSWLISRFGNGTFPVWYASNELHTSFHESIYHWHKTFILAPNFKQSLSTLRSVFTVNCNAALIDLRNQCKSIKDLIHPEKYTYCQQIGQRIHREGYPGLITLSARDNRGENLAIFKKEVLSTPKHYNDYLYEYDERKNVISVKTKGSNKIILKVDC